MGNLDRTQAALWAGFVGAIAAALATYSLAMRDWVQDRGCDDATATRRLRVGLDRQPRTWFAERPGPEPAPGGTSG